MNHADWNRHYAEREPPDAVDAHVRLEEEVSALAAGRALDLACGTGRNAIWLAQQGWDVTAVDFSDVAIASARRLADSAGAEVDWVVADLLDYHPPAQSYDLVTMMFLHLPPDELAQVIAAAAAAVAPQGTLLVAGHHRRNLDEGYRGPRDPRVLYGPEEIAARLDGLTVAKAATITRPISVPEGEAVMIDALVVAQASGIGAVSGR